MRKLLIFFVLASVPAFCQTAPKGFETGKITAVEESQATAHIFLEDGRMIDPNNPGDVFVKLLEHWHQHPARTTFFYKLGPKYNGLQDIEIRYFVNWSGGFRWKGAFTLPPEAPKSGSLSGFSPAP